MLLEHRHLGESAMRGARDQRGVVSLKISSATRNSASPGDKTKPAGLPVFFYSSDDVARIDDTIFILLNCDFFNRQQKFRSGPGPRLASAAFLTRGKHLTAIRPHCPSVKCRPEIFRRRQDKK